MIPKGQFYYMRGFEHEDRIRVHTHVKKALPILWNRGGEYKLVPKEVVQNAINSYNIYAKMTDKTTINPVVCIYWDQALPVENRIGRILTEEE